MDLKNCPPIIYFMPIATTEEWVLNIAAGPKKSHGTRAWPSQGVTNFRKWEHLKSHEAHGVLGGSSHLVINYIIPI